MSRGTLTTIVALPEAQSRATPPCTLRATRRSGVEAAQAPRLDDPVDRQDVGAGACVDFELFLRRPHGVKCSDHLFFEPLVHFGFPPEVAVAILNPLEIRDDHAAGVSQDVRHEQHTPTTQDYVGIWCGRPICALDDDSRL